MLVSKGNVPSNILPPSGLVSYFYSILLLILIIGPYIFQGPMQVDDEPAAPPPPKKDPPKQPSGKPCKTLEFP